MIRRNPVFALAALGLAGALVPSVALAEKSDPSSPPAATAAPRESDLYRDDAGESVANVTQVLPNARETQTVIQNVRLITIRQGVLVIAHSESAVTLMPQQFVSNISVNKRLAEKK